MLADIALIAFAYLLGSVSTALLVSRWFGIIDPRQAGSGNPGATNMLRLGGKTAGAVTLLGDMLKGVLPVVLAHLLEVDNLILALTGLAAFIGHVFPVYTGFRGGKGVATALGVALGWYWLVGVLMLLTWLLVALVFRFSSLAALITALLGPVYFWWLRPAPEVILAMACMTVLLYWRHRSNIRNLLDGSEGRIKL